MKYIRTFDTEAEMTAFQPEFTCLLGNKENNNVAFFQKKETAFIGKHGGMLATFNFDGTNNTIGGSALYNKLQAIYLDEKVYDIDDLVINVSGGSGSASASASGSGSGSTIFSIAFPDTVTGEHEVEFVLELDEDGTLDISGKGWFANCPAMTSVTIPYFVDIIDKYTFRGSTNITILNIDSNIIMEKYENQNDTRTNFRICFNGGFVDNKFTSSTLKTVIIGNSVTSIGEYKFEYCYNLESITVSSSVTSIGYDAFLMCTGLTSITVNTNNTTYNDGNCSNCIIETATNTLIAGCKNTVIPDSVTSIGNSAFYNCTGLTSITIPDSVTSIGNYAFSNCTGLTSVTIPDSVTTIDDGTFNQCTGLTSVNIPDSVTSIGNYAFSNCTGLTSVTIPDSVTSIGNSAFYNVEKVIYSGTATGSPWGAKEVVSK